MILICLSILVILVIAFFGSYFNWYLSLIIQPKTWKKSSFFNYLKVRTNILFSLPKSLASYSIYPHADSQSNNILHIHVCLSHHENINFDKLKHESHLDSLLHLNKNLQKIYGKFFSNLNTAAPTDEKLQHLSWSSSIRI